MPGRLATRPARWPPGPGQVVASLASIAPFTAPGEHDDRPVFLLATGWRTGSTLVQRLLATDPRLLLWGEPLGRMGLLGRLAEMVCGIHDGWPPAEYWIGSRVPDLATAWTANLFPPGEALRAGLRACFNRWLAEPARERGFLRWGFKEVRLGAVEASVLRWLYPGARFVVLVRDPRQAYASARDASAAWEFYQRWPDQRIATVSAFARHWNRLAMSWAEPQAHVTPIILRYEDVLRPDFDFAALACELDLELDPPRALGVKTGATGTGSRLHWRERIAIRLAAGSGMRRYGYRRAPAR